MSTTAEVDLTRPPVADRISEAACPHCGIATPSGGFCCAGCSAAYKLVQGIGLDAFYEKRRGARGTLRPTAPLHIDFAGHAVRADDGSCSLELLVAGLTCGACVWLIEQALAAEPDVLAARVSFSSRRLRIAWKSQPGRANELVDLLAQLGFQVTIWSPACLNISDDAEGRALVKAFGIAAFGAANVMLLSIAVWVGRDMGEATRAVLHWTGALIALPVVVTAGMPFYRSALSALRAGRLNMDFAISVAVIATTAMSISEVLRSGPFTWFDSATSLLALLLGGRLLERGARRKARQAVAELLALQHGEVTVLADDGTVRSAPVEQVAPGARILVATGERLRLDAVLESDDAVLDRSTSTGEVLPHTALAGGDLPAGSLNLGHAFTATVLTAADRGSLATIARLIERGEQARGRYVDLAQMAIRFYAPGVLAASLATLIWWSLGLGASWLEAIVPAVSVLIATCPCGLAIAVPAVQAVTVGALFQRGLLVASGTALERLATADHVVLDKTGTLSEGRPSLVPGDWTQAQLHAAAGLAKASQHPLARALAAAAPEAPVHAAVRELPGYGLETAAARLGSAAFTGAVGANAGLTLSYVENGGAHVSFQFTDRLRPEALSAVERLRELGLTLELVSGDARPSVASVARALSVVDWTAEASPMAKADRIQALRQAGRQPIMVGDGINDAAAMSLAYVSVAPRSGTDLAQTSADVVLGADDLAGLPEAIVAARRARRLMMQSIGLALAYNVLALPLAMTGVLTPLIAAVIMASSSILTTLNALRAKTG